MGYCRSANVGNRFNFVEWKKIVELKRRHHFPFHCKTYDFTEFSNFEQQICQIKMSPSFLYCQNLQLNTSSSFFDLQYVIGRMESSSQR